MFNLPILDFTISVVFVFFLFSLFAAALLELVNTVRKRRARILRDALDKVMNDPQNLNYAELLYNHPIIEASRKDPQSLPSYISAENFATALIDVITDQGRQVNIGMNANNSAQEIKSNILPQGTPIEQFRAGLATLKVSSFQRLLLSLSQFVKDTDGLNKKLVTWYNGYMDRVSGWFKRKSQKILMVLSAIVVIAFYVDFFHLAREFWNNDELRNQMVESAIETVKNNEVPPDPTTLEGIPKEQLTSLDTLKAEIKQRYNVVDSLYQDITDRSLPVGWRIAQDNWQWKAEIGFFGNIWEYIINLLSLAISVLAISRGAPFWFDTLNKLVNLRNSGKKPKVAEENNKQ